jgi:hypothetical protein
MNDIVPATPASTHSGKRAKAGIFNPTVAPKAPVKYIEEIWPEIFEREITLCELSYHPGGARFEELVFLASIARHLQPRRLFEIGTCRGRTTVNLAKNLDDFETFYTLNLPPDGSCEVDWIEQDRLLYEGSKNAIGQRWRRHEVNGVITQLYGDSKHFDFSRYNNIDLVFIDANKQADYVASDSINGLRMLNTNGVLIWHDYGYCDGVTLAVDEFAARTGTKVLHIYKTSIAVAWS